MHNLLKKIEKGFDQTTTYLLVFSLLVMLFFSVLTIVLRWFGTGLLWVEPLVRHLVFMSTFLGGILATAKGAHIGIDVSSKIFEARGMHFILRQSQRIIYLCSVSVLIWLSYASIEFVKSEQEYGKESFLGITSGQLVTMIPIGFSLIAFRFFLKFLETIFISKEIQK